MLDIVNIFKSGMHSIKRKMWNLNQMRQEAKIFGPMQYPGNIMRYNHVKAEFIPLQGNIYIYIYYISFHLFIYYGYYSTCKLFTF